MIELLLLLFIKHFIVDFPLQVQYQWRNKGTYGHPGGILHSGLHGIFTTICLCFFIGSYAIVLGLIDAVIHYHVDWCKMNINKRMGWDANSNDEFWYLLGFDQLLHALTYIWLVNMAVGLI